MPSALEPNRPTDTPLRSVIVRDGEGVMLPAALADEPGSRTETTVVTRGRRLIVLGRRYWPDLAFWLLAAALVTWVAFDALFVRLTSFLGGADYWEHTAALRSLIESPFSPRNPQVLSDVPSPRFGPHYLIVALLTKAFGGDALDAMALAGVLNTALFVSGIYLFFGTYFRDRRAPLYGLIVMFGSWWNAWNFSNVYQLRIYFAVAGYPSSAALAITLIGLWLSVRALRMPKTSPATIATLVAIWAYVFITHPLTAMLSLSGCVLLAAFEPDLPLRRRAWVAGTAVAACLVSAAWLCFPAWQVVAGGKGEESGWLARSVSGLAQGGEEYRLHYFYRTHRIANSLGLALIGIPICAYLLFTRYRFIAVGALSMAAPFIANAYIPLPLGHRFILLAIFYLQLAVVWLLVAASPKWDLAPLSLSDRAVGWAGSALVTLVLGATASLHLDDAWLAFENARAKAEGTESPFVRYAREVGELAGPNAVVLGDPIITWPLPTFGPRVVALEHENPLVEDRTARNEAVEVFLARRTKDAERVRILRHFRVTHVIVKEKQDRQQLGEFLSRHGRRHRLATGHRLYSLDRPQRAN
jgi:hypothetical protein